LNRKKRNRKQLNTTEEVFNKVIIKIFSTHPMNPWSSTKKKENHYSRTAKGDYMLIKAGNPKLHMERKKQKILRKLKLLKLMIWTKFIRIHLFK